MQNNKVFFLSLLNFKHKIYIFFLFILILFNMLFEMIGIGLIIPITSQLFDNGNILDSYLFFNKNFFDKYHIGTLILVFFSIYILKNIFLIFSNFGKYTFIKLINDQITADLLKRYLKKNYSFFSSKTSSEIIRNLTGVEIIGSIIDMSLHTITEIILLIGILTLLFIIEPISTLVVFSLLLFIGLIFFYFSKTKMKKWGEDRQDTSKIRIGYLQDLFVSIKEIILRKNNSKFLDSFNSKNRMYTSATKNFEIYQSLPRIVLELVIIIVLGIFLFLLSSNEFKSYEIIPLISVFIVAGIRLMPSMSRLLASLQYLSHHGVFLSIIKKELNHSHHYPVKSNKKIIFNNKLEVKRICFRYNKKEIIKNLSFNIKKNDFVGIVGDSGVGKSTLVNLISGLIKPDKGKIFCDGFDINQNINNWHLQIGYISQNSVLIDDTIASNISFGVNDEDLDINKILKICELLNINFIKNKNNLFRKSGERGSKLSGGQSQKILIARALYFNPDVLILDESTSALDVKSENEILKLLKKLNNSKTIILISHRKNSLKYCNNIIQL